MTLREAPGHDPGSIRSGLVGEEAFSIEPRPYVLHLRHQEVSDNTAANLLLDVVGGPPAVTAFVRGTGDATTRFDRTGPDLNVSTGAGDERDTTPAAIVGSIRAAALGSTLARAGRDRLTGCRVANTTGDATIRAGVPAGWVVGDKT